MPSEPSYRDILQDTLALLREIEAHYSPAALSNGFGPESMVLTDLIPGTSWPSKSSVSTPAACRLKPTHLRRRYASAMD